ncbi:hypothetical protein E1193_15230 [Micromonospora sp. KC606]|uniref:hypothetical protein n=1 Tax=Micromonospora sp. KC606 TaxID=2530379 RepID=UPI001047C72B|nr:hypothetical protein [Micromonospora sp. KC606]TDC81264.1 hypothetical protein E1193_15230 [Micromonospora sp. KC606]
MSEPETSDHGVVTQHARTTLPYRLAVWYLRSAMVSLPLAFIDFDRLWPIWPSVIVLSFICVSPVRYMAYFEWKLSQADLGVMLWRDAFSPRFR